MRLMSEFNQEVADTDLLVANLDLLVIYLHFCPLRSLLYRSYLSDLNDALKRVPVPEADSTTTMENITQMHGKKKFTLQKFT